MGTVLQDIRFGFRLFRKSPAFVIVIVLTLGLGIGANTSIFSLMNAVLLKTIPVSGPEQLAVVGDPAVVHLRAEGLPPRLDMFSYPLYKDLDQGNHVFSGLVASGEVGRIRVARTGGVESITDQALGALVSGNYFSVLGVNAIVGSVFSPADDDIDDPRPVAVISYGFWTEKFNRDHGIVGQTVLVNNFPFTIIGVARPGFYGDTIGDRQEIWFPVSMQAQILSGRTWLKDYGASWLHLIGRLKSGATIAQARTDLNVLLQQQVRGPLSDKFNGLDQAAIGNLRLEVEDGRQGFSELRSRFQQPLLLLMGIVGLVLLVTCVNVGNLLMVRSLARHREIAVRLSLGATKWRIVRQVLTESILLAFLGGILGLLFAQWGTGLLLSMSRTTALDVPMDAHVLAFTAGICLLAGILFGVVPAFHALGTSINSALKTRPEEAGTGDGSGRWKWGKILVVSQVGLSLWVLFDAGLFFRTMQNLRNADLGYERQNLLLVRTDPISAGYKALGQRVNMAEQLSVLLAGIPGAKAVTYSKNGIFTGSDTGATIKIEGFVPSRNDDLSVACDRVGAGYFSTLGISVIHGRDIASQDKADRPRVALINEAMADYYFSHADPIGRKIWIDDPDQKDHPFQIVGVVANAQDHGIRTQALRRFYVPLAQSQDPTGDLSFLIRTGISPESIVAAARKTIKSFDPAIPIVNARTLNERIEESISSEILIAKLTGFFGGLALVLASIGLYGVMSYTVTRKTRAIGIRMALGARPLDVLWLVMKEAIVLVVIGITVGIPLALICSRLLASMLFQLESTDPAAMSAVTLTLGIVALLASYLPARRAMKVDPLTTLKDG